MKGVYCVHATFGSTGSCTAYRPLVTWTFETIIGDVPGMLAPVPSTKLNCMFFVVLTGTPFSLSVPCSVICDGIAQSNEVPKHIPIRDRPIVFIVVLLGDALI